MSLPTTFTPTYDFSLLTNLQPFWDALYRRFAANNLTLLNTGEAINQTIAVGDDVSSVSLSPYYYPGFPRAVFSILSLQTNTIDISSVYIDPSKVAGLAGVSMSTGHLPLVKWQSTQPNETTYGPNIFKAIGCTTDSNGNYNFTRKRPARINTNTSIVYDDTCTNTANVINVGHIAYCNADGLKYVYTGSWSVVGNQQGALVTVLTGWGYIAAGDYIGPWIFSELAAIYPLCKKQIFSTTFAGATGFEATWTGTSYAGSAYRNDNYPGPYTNPPWPATGTGDQDNVLNWAKADATTAYAAGAAAFGVSGQSGYELGYTIADSTDPDTNGNHPPYSYAFANYKKNRGQGTSNVYAVAHAVPTSRTIDWYVWSQQITSVPYDTIGQSGIPIAPLILTFWTTSSPGTAALSRTTAFLPPTSAIPSMATTNTFYANHNSGAGVNVTGHSESVDGGFIMQNPVIIVNWNFVD